MPLNLGGNRRRNNPEQAASSSCRNDAGALRDHRVPIIALAASGATVALVPAAALPVAGILLLSGVLHGAGEVSANEIGRPKLTFILAYLALGFLAFVFCLSSPIVGLATFLTLAGWHFGVEHRRQGGGTFSSLGHALVPIGGGAFFQRDETLLAFAWVTGVHSFPTGFGEAVALAGLVGCVCWLFVIVKGRNGSLDATVTLVAVALLPPVLAVAYYFSLVHSRQTMIRLFVLFGPRDTLKATLPTGILAGFGVIVLIIIASLEFISLHILSACLIGLAIPHMILGDIRLGMHRSSR